MDAIKVKHCDIDRVSFDSKPLVILDDSEALGDDRLLKVITAEIKDAIVDIPPPPDNSSFRRMLARYYMQTYSSDKYEIAYVVQVHKFSKTSSITWDPEGQKRLVAHATLHDIVVELSNVECVFVKEGSIIFCPPYCTSIAVSPASSNQECILATFATRAKEGKVES